MNPSPLCLMLLCEDGKKAQDALNTIYRQAERQALGREVYGHFSTIVCPSGVLENFVKYGTPMPSFFTKAKARLVVGLDEESIQLIRKLETQIKDMKTQTTNSLFFLNMEELLQEECEQRQITKIWLQGAVNCLIDEVAKEKLSKAGLAVKHEKAKDIEIGAITLAVGLRFVEDVRLREAMVQEIRTKIARMTEWVDFQAYVMDSNLSAFLQAAAQTVPWGPEIIDLYSLALKGITARSMELAKENLYAD